MQQSRKGWRVGTVFIILIWIVLFATSLFLLQFLLTLLNTQQSQSVANLDWAGYVVNSNSGNPQPQVTGVDASWVVPRVEATNSDSYSSAWIGIGGQFDRSLIQAGTEHDYVNGNKFYFVWYELLPNTAIRITSMGISAGDTITASISLVNSNENQWVIQVSDITNGHHFEQNFFYNSSMLSAEWMVERPTVNKQLHQFGKLRKHYIHGRSC